MGECEVDTPVGMVLNLWFLRLFWEAAGQSPPISLCATSNSGERFNGNHQEMDRLLAFDSGKSSPC